MDVKSVCVSQFPTDGGRNLIGRRTESDRTADGIQSGGGRNPIRWRTVGGYGIPAIPTQYTHYQAIEIQQEGCVGMARMPYPPAIPTQSINYQEVVMQQEGCVGMARMPYPPTIPTQSTNYQTVAMQQEDCVCMARMPYTPNTEKAQSACALGFIVIWTSPN